MLIDQTNQPSRCLLIVGHPGHELRIFGWVKKMRPLAVALTDGSGHTLQPRLVASKALLMQLGAIPSKLYGISSDQAIYQRILQQDADYFLSLSAAIAQLIIDYQADMVIGDAIEGYNPVHDLCRLVIDKAVSIANQSRKLTLNNYSFPLVGHPSPDQLTKSQMVLTLTSAQLAQKIQLSQHYAKNSGDTLSSEVTHTIKQFGESAFATEVLSCLDSQLALANFIDSPPFYDKYGQQQVKAGHYQEAINFKDHLLPLSKQLLP
ncbi:MAG: hypothetical protein WC782_03085 [Methylococcaceae bacterium]|jgi:hypothetical protein